MQKFFLVFTFFGYIYAVKNDHTERVFELASKHVFIAQQLHTHTCEKQKKEHLKKQLEYTQEHVQKQAEQAVAQGEGSLEEVFFNAQHRAVQEKNVATALFLSEKTYQESRTWLNRPITELSLGAKLCAIVVVPASFFVGAFVGITVKIMAK